ncbi:MAG: hypothetical protein JSS62_01080 [Verrucomicrobia bacterium]|nr:hypothetical protein [Verrucomicrobiota bacterium]MBS0646062.1 hypothetical protein [Verrucomicrobiota bacterium]
MQINSLSQSCHKPCLFSHPCHKYTLVALSILGGTAGFLASQNILPSLHNLSLLRIAGSVSLILGCCMIACVVVILTRQRTPNIFSNEIRTLQECNENLEDQITCASTQFTQAVPNPSIVSLAKPHQQEIACIVYDLPARNPSPQQAEMGFVEELLMNPYETSPLIENAIFPTDLPQALSRYFEDLKQLNLCSCFKINTQQRLVLEETSIRYFQKHCSPTELLTIVSVGSGGCYQELVYLAKLAQAGFTHLQFVFIENNNEWDSSFDAVRELSYHNLSHCHVKLVKYTSINDYVMAAQDDTSLKAHLLLLLDISDSQYAIHGMPLFRHSFNLLQSRLLLLEGALINYSNSVRKSPGSCKAISYCYCREYESHDQNNLEQLYLLEEVKGIEYVPSDPHLF